MRLLVVLFQLSDRSIRLPSKGGERELILPSVLLHLLLALLNLRSIVSHLLEVPLDERLSFCREVSDEIGEVGESLTLLQGCLNGA